MENFSASKIKTFDICPRQFYYLYIANLFKEDKDYFTLGTEYHKILELHHSGKEEIDFNLFSEEAKNLFAKYLRAPVEGEVLSTEVRFNLDFDGYTINGVIDRIDKDKLVEYKTSSAKWKEEDCNNIQSDLYIYANWEINKTILPLVYSINNKKTKLPPQIIKVERDEEYLKRFKEELSLKIKEINNSKYERREGFHCGFCSWGEKGDGTCKEDKR